ncbi:MAG TPA: hypothetical protein VJ302_11905 [Blastocatellia bacterium]|nr:hypothetical protein [Blastocatellia bacterium]
MVLSWSSLVVAQTTGARFITRAGDRLMEGTKEFRFVSFNVPNLHLVEDNLPFAEENPWRMPDEFEIADTLETVRQMGGRVARTYVLSVRRDHEGPEIPRHVLGPGQFNEEAFRTLDKVLQLANAKGIRVIVPFVDQWRWWGGIGEYASFRGKPPEAFWTDPQLIADFKRTIKFLIERRNTYTGVVYRDDPAIFAWETGNELANPYSWSREIAAYIKSLDANHLVIDGYHAGLHGLPTEPIDDPNIDILTTHHYPGYQRSWFEAVADARRTIGGRKAYFVGEAGFVPTAEIGRLLDQVIRDGVSGVLIWSLRFRNRDGGFYWHSEPAGGGLYKAFHWPGSPVGDAYDERGLLRLMREKAFEIQGTPAPPLEPPAAPRLLPIRSVHAISWRGSVGATHYDVERAANPKGPWVIVGSDVDESLAPYRPLFADGFAEQGRQYFYRVRAKNAAGVSADSNLVGPVKVERLALIDQMCDLSRVFASGGHLARATGEPRKAKEDLDRVRGSRDAWMVYRTLHPIRSARVQVYFEHEVRDFEFLASSDGVTFTKIEAARRDYFKGSGDYGYWKPVTYEIENAPRGAYFLKLVFGTDAQIGRIEIEHQK